MKELSLSAATDSLVKHLISVWDDQKFTVLICRARPWENVSGKMN